MYLMDRWCEAYETAIDMTNEEEDICGLKERGVDVAGENYKKELGLPGFNVFPGLDRRFNSMTATEFASRTGLGTGMAPG
jgi:hypothetical protein